MFCKNDVVPVLTYVIAAKYSRVLTLSFPVKLIR